MKKRLKILDFYCHQGHQREFFRLKHDFVLTSVNLSKPKWNEDHRPLGKNVVLATGKEISDIQFDVVIIRSPVGEAKYRKFIDAGAIPIAVVQTTNDFSVPRECKYIVWNSLEVMRAYSGKYPNKKNRYIVHGYDPKEFAPSNIGRNRRILTVANVFKGRSEIMGYPLWAHIKRRMGNLDVIGHGNRDLYKADRQAQTFEDLIRIYNSYSIYFNPTQQSAMPRSRAEAAMCGLPIVSTDNFDIGMYFENKRNGIITNDRNEMIDTMREMLKSKQMRDDFGGAARETAIKHFHIYDFLLRWESILADI